MSEPAYDAVVVGARCAGAPAAMLLARSGYRVLLLDRRQDVEDKLCTHHMVRGGMEALARWGLADRLLGTGLPPMRSMVYEAGGEVRITGPVPVAGRLQGMYSPRRTVLDRILVDAAVSAGVDVRDRTTVTGVTAAGGRVTGVRYRRRGGGTGTIRARLVVGADGMRSSVAGAVGARVVREDARASCVYFRYWEGLDATFELYQRTGSFLNVEATHDGLAIVVSYFPRRDFARVRRDPWRSYLASIRATAPRLADRLDGARPVARLRASGDQPNFYREAAGPGWVLIGDAGCTKDSVMGTGITDAFRQAELLAGLLGPDLCDERRLDAALRRFAMDRHGLLDPGYQAAVEMARLRVDRAQCQYLDDIRSDPAATARLIDMLVGADPVAGKTPEGVRT